MKNKNKAFTLVEIVLAMAIIGVVAVLTITNATKDTDEATKVAQLRNVYNILNTNWTRIRLEDPSFFDGGYLYPENRTIIFDGLKIAKKCTENDDTSCWNMKNNINEYEWFEYGRTAILSNGASIAVAGNSNSNPGPLYVDINGPNKGNNLLGDDIFEFAVDNYEPYEFYPMGMNATLSASTDGACPKVPEMCTAWIIKMGNFDCFKCPEKLSWTEVGKSTCNQ